MLSYKFTLTLMGRDTDFNRALPLCNAQTIGQISQSINEIILHKV